MVEYIPYTDINFWTFFFPAALLYLGTMYGVRFGKIKIREGASKWLDWVAIGLGALVGFITFPGDLVTKIVAGGILYGPSLLVLRAIIIDNIIPKIIEVPEKEKSIKKLKIDQEYINLLLDSKIFTLEDLIKDDVRDLSENTGLSIETIISFRNKAKKFLKSKK